MATQTVSEFMAQKKASAVTQTPSAKGRGMITFFDPVGVCNSTVQGSKRLLNEALLFHEGLHGFTGLNDNQLLTDFGKSFGLASYEITYYINEEALGGSLTYTNTDPDSPGAPQCPN
jgi:hypothetical protein